VAKVFTGVGGNLEQQLEPRTLSTWTEEGDKTIVDAAVTTKAGEGHPHPGGKAGFKKAVIFMRILHG
jgi:hypothetical protein